MSQDNFVNTAKLRELCDEQLKLVLKDFAPFEFGITPTVHQLYCHLPEKIGRGPINKVKH